jgi:predicted XRE-type DNA-binding protein
MIKIKKYFIGVAMILTTLSGVCIAESAEALYKQADVFREEGMTQQQAADLMNIDQPKVSKIIRGLLSEFSIERLLKFVLALGFDLEIKPKPHKVKSTLPSMHIITTSFHLSRLGT